MRVKKSGKEAFTLVEVMIVVGILALLAAIAIPNLLRAKVSANDASAQSSLKIIASALESYAAINTQYPTATTDLINATPPYLNTDYFTGTHGGFSYTHSLAAYSYLVTATPINPSSGSSSFSITTGAVLQVN